MTEPRIEVLRTDPCVQFAVESASRKGKWHTVSYDLTTEEMSCTCEAFSFYDYKGLCRHCLAVIRYAAQASKKKRSRGATNTPAPIAALEAATQ